MAGMQAVRICTLHKLVCLCVGQVASSRLELGPTDYPQGYLVSGTKASTYSATLALGGL